MKRITLLLLAMVFSVSLTHAQDEEDNDIKLGQYDKWSIELSGGLLKPSNPLAPGYYTKGADLFQGNLGVRYMFNEKFGLRTVFGYNSIKNNEDETQSLPFEARYLRGTLEGVVNLGNVLDFADWTNSFGLLFHSGAGYSNLKYQDPEIEDPVHLMNISAGITPQVKISNSIAFNLDVTLLANVGMERSWDGTQVITSNNRRIDDGLLYNFSAGLTFYLGENDTHADWYSEDNVLLSKVEELEQRVEKLETDLIDSDQDGVPDYLDREPNTMSGVAVNTKGVAIDKNNNGIPDEIESSLDSRYVNEEDYVQNKGGLDVEELLNKGYVNVYFRFNSDVPETYSLGAINYLAKYM